MNELKLVNDLIRDESEVLHAYEDSEGFLTIGVGILIDKRKGGGITREESRYLLQNRIDRVTQSLDKFLPWWSQLDDVRQRALCNMCFQLGIAGLLGFKKMLRALEDRDWGKVDREARDSLWYKQTPERATRVINMLRTGMDP